MANQPIAPLPSGTSQLTSDIIAACIAVHRELGPGLLEALYQRAVCVELESRGITHEVERSIPIIFRNQAIGHHRLDLVVDNQVVVELKAVERLGPQHVAQAISYLRASRIRIALLVNFNVPVLKAGIRRVVL